MAHPKRRSSNSRTGKRRTHWKLKAVNTTACTNCGSTRIPHRVCGNCGYYNGREVIEGEGI
ncbi:TPA: 50S ribosomal protein L32 [Candidatus Latescibacteria bacterium]|nr:50S ribosomal protein L32 [Candidatus Latescibacterota bacterium]